MVLHLPMAGHLSMVDRHLCMDLVLPCMAHRHHYMMDHAHLIMAVRRPLMNQEIVLQDKVLGIQLTPTHQPGKQTMFINGFKIVMFVIRWFTKYNKKYGHESLSIFYSIRVGLNINICYIIVSSYLNFLRLTMEGYGGLFYNTKSPIHLTKANMQCFYCCSLFQRHYFDSVNAYRWLLVCAESKVCFILLQSNS